MPNRRRRPEVVLFGVGRTKLHFRDGDVTVLPAGVSHAMTGRSKHNQTVGGDADGRHRDGMREKYISEEDRLVALKRISMLSTRSRDRAMGGPMRGRIQAPSSLDDGPNEFREEPDPV